MQLIYFCGGPGLNPFPEENLLMEKYATAGFELKFWYDPSVFRPDGDPYTSENAFQNYLNSAEAFFLNHYDGQPSILIGYCFGCHPIHYLLTKHKEKIGQVFIITPDFSLPHTDHNILSFIRNDYEQNGDAESVKALDVVLTKYTGRFDENTESGFLLAAANPRLFDYYWRDKYWMNKFLQYYAGPRYGVDVQGFLDVRRTKFEIEERDIAVPAVIIYGKHDIVISIENERPKVNEIFVGPKIIEIAEASHYPHVEQADEVLAIIKREIEDRATAALDKMVVDGVND